MSQSDAVGKIETSIARIAKIVETHDKIVSLHTDMSEKFEILSVQNAKLLEHNAALENLIDENQKQNDKKLNKLRAENDQIKLEVVSNHEKFEQYAKLTERRLRQREDALSGVLGTLTSAINKVISTASDAEMKRDSFKKLLQPMEEVRKILHSRGF